MRALTVVSSLIVLAAVAQAQAPRSAKPLGSWNIEYERTILRMHGEPTRITERGRMTLRSVGDSVFGELAIGDSATANLSVLRGTAGKTGYAVYAEEPPAKGFGLFFSAFGAAMDWLRESVHGIHPVIVRFDVTAKGDSLTGSRTATGGMSPAPRVSPVTGRRVP